MSDAARIPIATGQTGEPRPLSRRQTRRYERRYNDNADLYLSRGHQTLSVNAMTATLSPMNCAPAFCSAWRKSRRSPADDCHDVRIIETYVHKPPDETALDVLETGTGVVLRREQAEDTEAMKRIQAREA